VTEAETVAALAAQVDDLRGQVAKYQAIVTAWNTRLETEGIGATLVVRAEVKRMRETLDDAIARHRVGGPPAPWWLGLTREQYQARMADLHGWVEGFLRLHYPGYLARLPRCWPNHWEAAWELSTLRAEWERIYADEDNRDLGGALVWHEKFFPGVLDRLGRSIACDEAGCRVARQRPS
jgi:hypothetical protein